MDIARERLNERRLIMYNNAVLQDKFFKVYGVARVLSGCILLEKTNITTKEQAVLWLHHYRYEFPNSKFILIGRP